MKKKEVELGERIRLVRETLGMNQADFSSSIGITQGPLSQMEKGAISPSTQTLKFICDRYFLREEWLKKGTGEMFTGLMAQVLASINRANANADHWRTEAETWKNLYLSIVNKVKK